MINRIIKDQIMAQLDKGKVIHIPGPRQSGKTTLVKEIYNHANMPALWLDGDESDIREMFKNPTSTRIKSLIGTNKLIIIDEAQRIEEIGLVLKLIHDNISGISVIATGSTAFELSGKINEPLTGRKTELFLFPLSYNELADNLGVIEEGRLLEHRIIYGTYPEVVMSPGNEKVALKRLSDAFLYKDILSYQGMKKPYLLEKLLQSLALQVGNEVSYNELGQTTGADNETVERYIDLLEKAYIVFRLTALSRNSRNEIKKGKKIYFYDNGIRNAVIRNFNPLALRQDKGALWENYLLSERLKATGYSGKWINRFFWRTHTQQEIDYIEEYGGGFHAYEFKWKGKKKISPPTVFMANYPNSTFRMISLENYTEFIDIHKIE